MTLTIKRIFKSPPLDEEILVHGWVRTLRKGGSVYFMELNDGSCFENLQIVIDVNNFSISLNQVNLGVAVAVRGKLVKSPAPKQPIELQAHSIQILGEHNFEEYPIQKKATSLEFLREIAHLRPRTNTIGAAMRIRSTVSYIIHKFFQERDFYYIHTPIITASDCEGAGEMFRVTTLEPGDTNIQTDFFCRNAYLTVSGQLEAEALALALGRVYTFGPTFRAENSNTTRHLAEFWMIEPEIAFFNLSDDIDLAEELLKYCCSAVLELHEADLHWLEKFNEFNLLKNLADFIDKPVNRITYTEAVEILRKNKDQFEFEPVWGDDLKTEHEKFLVDNYFKGAVVVTNYPKKIKAFYMYQNDDETVACLDFLLPRVGETIGGSQREHRYDKLLSRMTELGMDLENYKWYLDLRRFGSVPHSGFGLGLERFLLFLTGLKNVRDVIPFPRYPGNVDF